MVSMNEIDNISCVTIVQCWKIPIDNGAIFNIFSHKLMCWEMDTYEELNVLFPDSVNGPYALLYKLPFLAWELITDIIFFTW